MIFPDPLRKDTISSEFFYLLTLMFYDSVLISIPVIGTGFIIPAAHPIIIILIHLTVTDIFFVILIINQIRAACAQIIHILLFSYAYYNVFFSYVFSCSFALKDI